METELNEKKMLWRCRRGIRELDVLFGQFLKTEFPQLEMPEKQAFVRLLEVQDPIIMDWLFSRANSDDAEIAAIIAKLQVLSGVND